ncbi:MAG: acetylornithine transaminase [Actinomycetaceae bacterium]|nr:acetylornithine transaminase [Actinomycetaceae bacterium]
MSNWSSRYEESMLGVFGTPMLVLARGEGVFVWDVDGKRYMDLLGGIAVNALGHAHPAVHAAIEKQARTLIHASNFFATMPQIELGEKIREVVAPGQPAKVFLANSGTEANEAALKIVKAHGKASGKSRILVLERAFHGRTLGALSLTYKEAYREPFAPLIPGIEWITPTVEALEAAFDENVAGIFVEPIQGEAGVLEVPAGFLERTRELCDEYGALMVVDEVQTGIGRTGKWMGHHGRGIVPDVVTLAKALGGGVPIGAAVTLTEVAGGILTPGMHGTTFGGNPVAAAAAIAVLDEITSKNLVSHAATLGAQWMENIRALNHPHIKAVRGQGLLIGIELDQPLAAKALKVALQEGFIVNAANPSTIRLAPPLIITAEQAGEFTDALWGILAKTYEEGE